MRKLFLFLTVVVLLSLALLMGFEVNRPLPSAYAPPFDVNAVVAQARNQVRAEGNTLVVENWHHRAEFSPFGLRYVPMRGEVTQDEHAFHYQLVEIQTGEGTRHVPMVQPAVEGANRVAYTRGLGVTEAYLAMDSGVEQLFVLDRSLGEGDVTLVGRVTTNLEPRRHPDGGIRFLAQGWEALRYGTATAFDDAGSTTNVRVELDGERLSLIVPGEWLAAAVYPVTVDPFIGGDILISTAGMHQLHPDLAYNDDDDEWLVVWEDDRHGGFSRIYGQIVNSSGILLGGPIEISAESDYLQTPAVAYDTTQRRYLVVWERYEDGAIEGRVLGAGGSFLTNIFQITAGGHYSWPDLAYNPVSDEYLVVWAEDVGGSNLDIWGRKVGVDGVPDPGGAYAIRSHASMDNAPALIAYPAAYNGQYLLVWRSDSTGTHNVLGRRLQSDGSKIGLNFLIHQGSGHEIEPTPQLASNPATGEALVVWEDDRNDDGDIYGRLVNSDGSRGAEAVINSNAGVQDAPSVAYNTTEGEYLVVWDDEAQIYGRQVSADTTTLGDSFALTGITEGIRYDSVVVFGTDRYFTVWVDWRSSFADIFGQRIQSSGELMGYETGVSTLDADQDSPALAFNTRRDWWLVVWQDERNGSHDIYGQFVTRDGYLESYATAICINGSDQWAPDVAYNVDDDEFLVVWADERNGHLDIYGRRVDGLHGTLLEEIRITGNTDDQDNPAVAYSDITGQYLVVWEDNRDDPGDNSDFNVYGRRLDSDGSYADAGVLGISLRDENQGAVDVAYNPVDDQYLVVWTDESLDNTGAGIAGQRIGAGSPWREGNNFDIATGSGQLRQFSVACNTRDGEYLVVWEDIISVANVDISGRRVGGNGALLGNGDIAISTEAHIQSDPNVSYGPTSQRYYVTWNDYRNVLMGADIYGQSLSASGDLLFTDAETNVPAWICPGWQESPASAADPDDDLTLLVWEDWRNGDSSNIYGRLGEPEPLDEYTIYLPLVVRE